MIDNFCNKILHGDCIGIMKDIPDKSVDLILTDPPYNVSSDTKIIRDGGKFKKAKTIDMNFGDWDWGSILPIDYIDEFVRILKSEGVLCLFYNMLFVGMIGYYLQEKHNFTVRCIGSWVKKNPAPQARKVKWQTGTEMFLVATKNSGTGHHFNYKLGQSPDYFTTSINYEHLHPNQKPDSLFAWIVKYWSFENDLVLDPFIGSGTTAIACLNTNRQFIGIELSEKYYKIAEKRAKQVKTDIDKSFIKPWECF